jgi:hypothetical protein
MYIRIIALGHIQPSKLSSAQPKLNNLGVPQVFLHMIFADIPV